MANQAKKKRRKGSVRRVPSGRWQARVMVGGLEISKVVDTRREAKALIQSVQEMLNPAPSTGPTLVSFSKTWMEKREAIGGSRHMKKEWSLWRNYILEWPDAQRPIRSLRTKHLNSYMSQLAMTDRSRQTVKHAYRIIKRALDAAVAAELVKTNIATEVEVPKMANRGKRMIVFLTPGEIQMALRCPQPANKLLERQSIYAVAIYAGLRKSELWALRWENIIFDGLRPRIEVRGPLKTAFAMRDVPMLVPVESTLKAWRGKCPDPSPGALVWPSQDMGQHHQDFDAGWRDKPYNSSGRKKVRQGTKSRSGIDRHIRFHDLRHTCASHLVQGTWGHALSLLETKKWMGHSSIQVTELYAHVSPDGVHGKAKKMNKTLDWS